MSEKASIQLFLRGGDTPELDSVIFSHPILASTLTSTRGKDVRFSQLTGTFQWTSAVKGLTQLFVKAAKSRLQVKTTGIEDHLQGESGSIAASLDYAISKQPNWLVEMFGCDSSGRTLAQRIFNRCNSERKRVGPVIISINEKFLPLKCIEILLDDMKVCSIEKLDDILIALIGSWQRSKLNETKQGTLSNRIEKVKPSLTEHIECEDTKLDFLPFPFNDLKTFTNLINSFISEAYRSLWETDIFSNQRINGLVGKLVKNDLFVKRAGQRKVPLITALPQLCGNFFVDNSLDSSPIKEFPQRHGQLLKISIGAVGVGPIAIFQYLIQKAKLPICIDYKYSNSQEIISCIKENRSKTPFDCVVLSAACTATLIRENSYLVPIMILPKSTHRVSSRTDCLIPKSLGESSKVFIESFSTSLLFFSGLGIEMNRRKDMSLSQEEIPAALADNPEARSILWFPHYYFNEIFNQIPSHDILNRDSGYDVNVLFIRNDIFRDESLLRCLISQIRDAWVTVRSSRLFLRSILEPVVKDPGYINYIYKSCGIYNYTLIKDMNLAPKLSST